MKKLIVSVGLLFATSLCCTSMRANATEIKNASSSQDNKETLSMLSIMKDIKVNVPKENLDGYSGDAIFVLWKQLQPKVTSEFIANYGEDFVKQFVEAAVDYVKWDKKPHIDLPNLKTTKEQNSIKVYANELNNFTGQVVTLYDYLIRNRSTPQLIANDQFAVQQVYTTPKDGCYYGMGDERNIYDPYGIDCEECVKNGGKPKANGAYVWGMVSDGQQLYWSTNNNFLCMPGYGQIATTGGSAEVENSCWVCEYEKGLRAKELAEVNPDMAKYGDIMPPRIYCYNPKTGVVTDITPEDDALKYSQGLRSAAYHKGVVFFGGPNFTGADPQYSSSSTFLAYSPERGEFLGSSNMASVSGCTITNVRRWIVIDDVLYCGVGLIKDGVAGGGIMRWNGSVDDPFKFEIVGYTPAEAAEIEYHNGHIYIGGWPIAKFGQAQQVASALYKSPELPKGGFTAANATTWPKVWEYTSYEPNPTSYGNTYFSVMKSFKGRLYWGMFSGTYSALYRAQRMFGSLESAEALAYVLGSLRATTLFSAVDVTGNNEDVEMLYGESQLPVYNSESKKWTIVDNGSNYVPRWGRSGYGNLFTCYTWAMTKYNDKLFIGTMDMAGLIDPAMEEIKMDEEAGEADKAHARETLETLKRLLHVDSKKFGYECLMLTDHDTQPEYVTDNGFGNSAAYAIRNMEVCDGKIFIGTANPFNLHENGGWQILTLQENNSTDISSPVTKPAGLLFKQNAYYLEISSMKGEKIQRVTLTSLSGKTVTSEKYGRTLASVITTGLPIGVYVATVTTDSETYHQKIVIK